MFAMYGIDTKSMIISDEAGNSKGVRMIGYIGEETLATETASAV